MNGFYIIGLTFLFQISAYLLLDNYGFKYWKYLILGIILVFYFFFPFLLPSTEKDVPRCGMSAMALVLGFWIFGGGATVLTHLLYISLKKIAD